MASAPAALLDLVERFDRHVDAYRSGRYNETQARREFIDPLFACLGWDVNNERGYAEAYKDVVHEDAIKIGGATKAPDYCFRVGGTRKFFVEAKKPSVNVGEDVSAAYQLRRYAWSAKLPLSILTDFEELAVYDCRVKPDRSDGPATARIMHLQFRDYPARWDELAGVFSREAVLQGSFDRYAASTGRKRGTAGVDDAFLVEIDAWREQLARNLALRNPDLTSRQLNDAVQRTIDRIIFLRIAEDRGIEPYGRLMALLNGGDAYQRLCDLYRQADERYNSGLFHFGHEAGRSEPPDDLTPHLRLDDRVLKEIVRGLYYPDSPYEFSVLPADILGQVYERFLGKVIRLTPSHQARVDVKPEVKRAGGVFYTPTYIVEYIVEHTLGPLLEGKTVRQVGGEHRGTPLRVVDPACGSGSFLLGAYQYLLDWYRDRYVADDAANWANGARPRLFQGPEGEWHLTTAERRRILLTHIYGVDIDLQAVEVTKLSLLLKVLEGESGQRLATQLAFLHERALPDLGSNIQCGNALIGSDYYHGRQMAFLDEEERYRVNPFDWEVEFAEIMAAGGFDAVIGNPPYGASFDKEQAAYYREHYDCAAGSVDSYGLFIEQAIRLLREGGLFGQIVQSGWVSAPSMAQLRRVFVKTSRPLVFASMPYDVFGAYIDTVVVIAERLPQDQSLDRLQSAPVKLVVFPPRHKVRSVSDFEQFAKAADSTQWLDSPGQEFVVTLSTEEMRIARKMRGLQPFSDLLDIQRGVTPFHPTVEPPGVLPFLAFTGTVRRYTLHHGEPAHIRYDETLAEYKPSRYFCGPRILLRELISRQFQLQAVIAREDFVTNKSMQSLLLVDRRYGLEYVLGILNSKLISWFFLAIHSVGRRDDFPKIVLRQTRELPIRTIDFSDPADVARHDRLVSLVEAMLALHEQLAAARTPSAKTLLQRQIDATDREIDALVYDLYDLTPEEIRIVEDETRRA